MRRFVLVAALLLVIALALSACSSRARGQITGADAAPDAIPDLVGTYSVNGVDPSGIEYGGSLTISPGAGDGQYKLLWIVTGSLQEGTGVLEGNRLRVEWRTIDQRSRPTTGVTIYTVTTKGELYGPRQVAGYDGEGSENAFPNDYD